MVTLEKITEKTLYKCLGMKVEESQKSFVASNAFSLAEAWMYGDCARPFLIVADGEPVGFFMGSVEPAKPYPKYGIWRLMIDQKHQGKGYGRQGLNLAIEYLKGEGAKEIFLSYEPENVNAAKLYESVGFVLTGEVDDGEVVAKLTV